MHIEDLARPVWVEIDLDAVTNNVTGLAKMLESRGPVQIIGAIKAHGYGHGLVPLARHLVGIGIGILAVGNIKDGIKLRKSGISVPVQVFGNTFPDAARLYVNHDLMPTFFNADDPQQYRKVLGEETPLNVWIKVETGLGRLGVPVDEVPDMIDYMNRNTRFKVEGVYTHIGARAALGETEDLVFVEDQWQRFKDLADRLEQSGANIPYYQAASSPACLSMPHTWMNCVCIGGGLFADPEPAIRKIDLPFKKAYKAIRSKLISVKHFKKGDQIGVHKLERDSVIGVAPIGLGDGLSGKNRDHPVLVRGNRCAIRGSISLEHIRIDVTDVPGVRVGDEVTILGKQGDDEITVEEMCSRTGYSAAQLWTSIKQTSVPYVFFRDGKVWAVEECE